MEHSAGYSSVQGGGFSVTSLAEGSEPISEAEEINEVRYLQEKGDKALKTSGYSDALQFYSEALEIDDRNTDVLLARATTYIKMKNYALAKKDTEILTVLCPDSSQAHFLHGVALKYLKKSRHALKEFLTALDLGPERVDQLTDHIAATAASFCSITPDLMQSLKEMDPYKKMSEVGACLYAAGRYSLCVKILEAAQKFRTNQKGITMRVLLTMANAHSALQDEDQAIGLYQECLAIASSIHDQLYQTKALVNIATLNLIIGDYHQAIVHYEKMLDLEAELREEAGEGRGLPEFWTPQLQSGLHLNLSVAYKTIGNMTDAMKHARKYSFLLEKMGTTGKQMAESYYNTGMLSVILQNYKEAAENYKKFLEESEIKGDQKGIAQAYGCLGTVCASLGDWKQALRYHQQDIAIATKMGDMRMQTMAHEMLGDTLMMKKDYDDAVKAYDAMLKCCRGIDDWLEAMGYCKTGNAYKAAQKHQYSLYYYQRTMSQFTDPKFKLIQMTCMYNMALILVNSTQLRDMQEAKGYLEKLIPHFESKIQQHHDEDSHCEPNYHKQLRECCDAMQGVLVKLGLKDTALQYAEAFRKRTIVEMPNYQIKSKLPRESSSFELASMDRLLQSVSQQTALVLYFSLLPKQLLLWVLSPTGGLNRFYCSKTANDETMVEQICALVAQLWKGRDHRQMMTGCENRALPHKNSEKPNFMVSEEKNDGIQGKENQNIPRSNSEDSKPNSCPQRQLYNWLLAPIEDILMKCETGSPLVVIPDNNLSCCPFGCLQDESGIMLNQKFSVTYMPSILSLDIVVKSEQDFLKAQDELNFERLQARHGSMNKYLTQYVLDNCMVSNSSLEDELLPPANPKQVSNPGLLRPDKNIDRVSTMMTPRPQSVSRMSSAGCKKTPADRQTSTLHPLPKLTNSVSLKSIKPLGSPPGLTKLLFQDTLSTLTPWTSTGTDITRSHRMITEFQQISNKERCVVIGNPQLPQSLMLHGKPWQPGEDLAFAKQEVQLVSSYLDVDPLTGKDMTKQRFLEEIAKATVLHIATFGCWDEGTLVITPNDLSEIDEGCPQDSMYLVTPGDLLTVQMRAQLVVLNCGWSPYRTDIKHTDFRLASAFLAAGSQCVLQTLWAVPNSTLEVFYYHFYQTLQTGSLITVAVSTAIRALQEDSRFSDPFFWTPFVLIGKDVFVNVRKIRHAMLDQKLDETEEVMQNLCDQDWLNPKSRALLVCHAGRKLLEAIMIRRHNPQLNRDSGYHLPSAYNDLIMTLNPEAINPELVFYNHAQNFSPTAVSREERLHKLQLHICKVLQDNHRQPQAIHSLIDLLDEALKRLHTEENNKKTTRLCNELNDSLGAMDILHFLGFHFQAKGPYVENPYVVYPHWNFQDLLVPTYDALKASADIVKNPACVQALCDLFPLTQEVISHLIDLLSITKHASEIQLKVSDLSVRPLWQKTKVKALLLAMGFHQIGMLLAFSNVPDNRRVLTAVLQLLLTVSSHKSQVLLYKLDVSLLGKPPSQKVSVGMKSGKLQSLCPVIVNKGQVRLSTPWMTVVEKPQEMTEKMKLAKSKRITDRSFSRLQEKARSWHQMTVSAQGDVAMDDTGRPKTYPSKVKVKPGSSLTQERVPVDEQPKLDILMTGQRREYAHYILDHRLQEVANQNQEEVRNLYHMPYVQAL